jgi:chromosome segregation ATPase
MAFVPVAIITAGVAVFEFTEKLKKQQEELEKQARKAWESAEAIGKMGEAIETQNLHLEDQIRLLQGLPAQNGPALAAEEARKKIDELVKSLDKAIEEEDKLMEKLAGNWFSQATFSDGWVKTLAAEFHGSISFVQNEITNLENSIAATKARLQADRDAGKDTSADQEQLAAFQKTLDEKREYLRKYLTDTTDANSAAAKLQAEKIKQIATLTADGVAEEGTVIPGMSPGAAKKAVDEQSATLESGLNAMVAAELNASHTVKVIHENTSLVKRKDDLEDAARADAQTTKSLQDAQKVADGELKNLEAVAIAKKKAADSMPEHMKVRFRPVWPSNLRPSMKRAKSRPKVWTSALLGSRTGGAKLTRRIRRIKSSTKRSWASTTTPSKNYSRTLLISRHR